ncbi:MAG: cyclase family protein [Lachnospiraceae bacterium]|nr:cyclase family protein [Lachnospiraceae bacterium]
MRIIDISQEVLSCKVFPGDDSPKAELVKSMEDGELYNLSMLSMCAHNGTHIDAPFHFINEGKTVDKMPLEAFVGDCYVARHEGDVTAENAREILEKAKNVGADEKILIGGKATVTLEAAKVFAEAGVKLIGNESQTVGPEDAPMAVHLVLLAKEIVLLEGLVLSDVSEGKYFLSAAPLNFAGFDGAPCRAYLMEK